MVADLRRGLPSDWSPECPVDVVLAGTPCQGFSLAGSMSPNDPRNELTTIGARIAVQLSPRIVLMENVAAAVKQQPWRNAQQLFRDAGYKTFTMMWSALDFGVPQLRKRAFLIAVKSEFNERIFKPKPSAFRPTVADVIGNVCPAEDHKPKILPPGSRGRLIAEKIKPGMKLCNVRNSPRALRTWDIGSVFGQVTRKERSVLEALVVLRRRNRVRKFGDADPVSATEISKFLEWPSTAMLRKLIRKGFVKKVTGKYDITHTFNGKYRRLRWDELSPAVTTKFGEPSHFLHPTEHRDWR